MEEKSISITIRLPPTLHKRIMDESSRQGITPSMLVRRFAEKELDICGMENNLSLISDVIEQVFEKNIDNLNKRLIGLIQKNGKISAASYFLNLAILAEEKTTTANLSEMIQNSNKLAVDFIKYKNSNVEEFLENTDELIEKAKRINKKVILFEGED